MNLRRILAASLLAAAASTLALGQGEPTRPRVRPAGDEEKLDRLVRDWADAVVHGDLQRLDRLEADDFKGTSDGKGFDKRTLREALRSGLMKIASWTMEDVKVSIKGNSAVVTGKSTLTNATYMGQDYSGEYEWTDRFVKQRDGSWRAVSSQSKRVKKD